MIKYTWTRLLYPEPEDTGGGDVKTPEETESGGNAFDFDSPDFDKGQEDAEIQQEEQAEDSDYALELGEELGLDASEVEIFTNAAKKHGIDSAAASGMITDFTQAINENIKRVQEERAKMEADALREQWGADFDANKRKAAALIKKVGQAAGWSVEQMNSFKNADSIRVFYDIARVMGTGRTVGLDGGAAKEVPMTKASIERELMQTVSDFWNARSSGDNELAKQLADKHHMLQMKLTGKKSPRLLRA